LVGDILKGYFPLLAFNHGLNPSSDQMAIACTVAIIGHCYPIYLGFKGGKGVATGLGILLVLSPWAVAGAAIVFLASVAVFRFISVGSIMAALSAPVLMLMLNQPQPYFLATLFIAMLITWRHRSNIKRLLDGSENRFKA
jgi:glycerol-3-phosphate acyltransferase PlsY